MKKIFDLFFRTKIVESKFLKYSLLTSIVLLLIAIYTTNTLAAPAIPKINIGIDEAKNPRDVALTLEILFLFTVLSLAPGIIMMMTSFTRIVIVFMFLQRALSLQQMPPQQVIVSIAIFMTFYIMAPTISEINKVAVQPYMNGQMKFSQAFENSLKPVRKFMFKHIKEKDLALFLDLAKAKRPRTKEDVPTHILIPAFVLGELQTAFMIGLLLYIPFIVIDMVVASTLMSMGMIMLPPIMISIPFKILVFVMVDGWSLVTYQLILSYR
jgi:flagellar biosynthetic protein FliP